MHVRMRARLAASSFLTEAISPQAFSEPSPTSFSTTCLPHFFLIPLSSVLTRSAK